MTKEQLSPPPLDNARRIRLPEQPLREEVTQFIDDFRKLIQIAAEIVATKMPGAKPPLLLVDLGGLGVQVEKIFDPDRQSHRPALYLTTVVCPNWSDTPEGKRTITKFSETNDIFEPPKPFFETTIPSFVLALHSLLQRYLGEDLTPEIRLRIYINDIINEGWIPLSPNKVQVILNENLKSIREWLAKGGNKLIETHNIPFNGQVKVAFQSKLWKNQTLLIPELPEKRISVWELAQRLMSGRPKWFGPDPVLSPQTELVKRLWKEIWEAESWAVENREYGFDLKRATAIQSQAMADRMKFLTLMYLLDGVALIARNGQKPLPTVTLGTVWGPHSNLIHEKWKHGREIFEKERNIPFITVGPGIRHRWGDAGLLGLDKPLNWLDLLESLR